MLRRTYFKSIFGLVTALAAALILVSGNFAAACAFQDKVPAYDFFNQSPQNAPASVIELLGRYENIENSRNSFLILEDSGTVQMLSADVYYPLERVNSLKYRFVKCPGADAAECTVDFMQTAGPGGYYCTLNGKLFRKVTYGNETGGAYKIKPLKPIEELRKTALAARPPHEPDVTLECELYDLRRIGENLKFDIRYATENNFMGERFYESQGAFLQKPAAYALLYVARSLSRHGLGMIVYDAYRPWYVTRMFYDATPDAQKNFVADPAKGSRHNRGTAVDVGLYDLKTGELIDMGSGYDEFSERASPKFAGATSYSRWHRKLLEHYMNRVGFSVYEDEWWHFDYKLGIMKYPIMNKTFDQLGGGR